MRVQCAGVLLRVRMDRASSADGFVGRREREMDGAVAFGQPDHHHPYPSPSIPITRINQPWEHQPSHTGSHDDDWIAMLGKEGEEREQQPLDPIGRPASPAAASSWSVEEDERDTWR